MKADDFFGGAPSLSWARQDQNGEWVDVPELLNVVRGGVVTAVGEPVQMTEMGTGKPLWWKTPDEDPAGKGQPKYKIIITVRCDGSGRGIDERNHADPSDLGERQLHVQSKDMREAIGAACRKTGNRGVRVGSELYVAWTGKRPSKLKNAKAARTWAALYVPREVELPAEPTPGSATDPFQGAGQVGPPAHQQPAQQAPAAPPWEQSAQPTAPPRQVAPWEQPAQQVPAASAAQRGNPFD